MKITKLSGRQLSISPKALWIGLVTIALISLQTGDLRSAYAVTLADQTETSNPEAYGAYSRGWELYRQSTPEDLANAVVFLKQAVELDPDYSSAHSALAAVYWNIVWNSWWHKSLGLFASQAIEQSRLSLRKAMEHPSALTHQVASERAAHFNRKPNKALVEAERAIALDANDPAGHLAMSTALLKDDRPSEAVESVLTAMRLNPNYPASYLTRLGQAQIANGQFDNAAESLEKAAIGNPDDDWIFVYLAAAYGQLGYEQKAKQALKTANTLRAKVGWGALTTQVIGRLQDFASGPRYFKWVGDYKPLYEGLRKAGVTTEVNWRSLISSGTEGLEIRGATMIDTEKAKALHERGVPFVDAHFNWVQGHIPGAYFLELWTREFNEARLEEIVDKDQEIVIYSSRLDDDRYAPAASARAVLWGFEKIYYYREGLDGWKNAGYPVETGK